MILEKPHRGSRVWSLAIAAALFVFWAVFPGRCVAESHGLSGMKLPMSFEVNEGQTDSQVKFLSRGCGYTLFVTPAEAVLALRSSAEMPAGRARTKATQNRRTPQQTSAAIL